MTEERDWRLDILGDRVVAGEIMGLEFTLRAFETPPDKPRYDHDHCEACFQKIMNHDGENIDKQGYVTRCGGTWICETCFADFRERFEWRVSGE